jgi:hypothetical protein
MSINFQEILKELEYRVEHGIIDLTKEEQVTKLVEILRENGVSDANEMAQKARVYYSYLNEAPKKQPLDKVLAQKFVNPETDREVTVASALGYEKNKKAYGIAQGMMKTAGYSNKDIDMVDAGPGDEEKPKGKKLGGGDYELDIEKDKKEKPTQSKDPKVVEKQAKEIIQKVYGSNGKGALLQNSPSSDAALKYGYQEGAWWVAPGNAGSNFNENMSDEGVKILEKYPDLDEETLAMVIFNKTRGTALGEQQNDVVIKSKNKINIPPTIKSKEEAQLYKNCVIAARSAKRKHDRIKEEITEAQQKLGFGKKITISTHGGTSRKAETPKNVQTDRDNIISKIDASNKCYMRDKGTGKIYEIPKEVLKGWVNNSGGGENAADTVVLATDEKGNLLYDGWSDKKTMGDLQANGTLNNDMVLADQRIDDLIKNGQIDSKNVSKAKKIVKDGKDRITLVERGYKTVASLQAKYFLGLSDKQFAAMEKEVATNKETTKHYKKYAAIVKNVVAGNGNDSEKSVAIAEQVSGVKRKKSKEEVLADKYIESTLEKYGEESVSDLAKNEKITPEELKAVKKALDAGKAGRAEYMNDFKVWLGKNKAKVSKVSPFRILNNVLITNPDVVSNDERKIIEKPAAKERDRIKASGERLPKSLDTQKVLEAMRKEALDLQRDTYKQLNKIPAKTASGQPTMVGNLIAYKEAEAFLHLDKIDLPKDDTDYHQIMKRNTQLTMEGIDITPETIKDCLGVDDTSDLQDHFVVGFDDERYQKNKEGFITGKVICLYIVDKNGRKREIAPKTFRPKAGQTAPTSNTVSWAEDMQKCFDSKR